MLLWFGFLACTSVIVVSGFRLSRYGDIIAEKTGLGRTWIGVVLMATVTSLPELVTGLSSVTYAGTPDIAVGDVLGSCVFNMLILVLLDAVYRVKPISAKAHQGNVLSAGFGILLLGLVGISIFVCNALPVLGWIGVYSFIFMGIFFLAMRMVFQYEKKQRSAYMKEVAEEPKYAHITAAKAALNYGFHAAVVIMAAIFLPSIGEGIAETTGLGQTFVGTLFIALSTSLPEVVVSLAAVRMDAVDLAIGNLFGSNMFNILILAVDDIFFTAGPLLSSVNPNHLISALSAMAMTSVAIIGLTYRSDKKRLLGWDSAGLVLLYIVNLVLLYVQREP